MVDVWRVAILHVVRGSVEVFWLERHIYNSGYGRIKWVPPSCHLGFWANHVGKTRPALGHAACACANARSEGSIGALASRNSHSHRITHVAIYHGASTFRARCHSHVEYRKSQEYWCVGMCTASCKSQVASCKRIVCRILHVLSLQHGV